MNRTVITRCVSCLLAILFVGTCTSVDAGKSPSPFTGRYVGVVYFDTLYIEISSRGSVTGSWGWDFGASVSGKISNDGVFTARLGPRSKRYGDGIEAIGLFALDESGSLVGVIQFNDLQPQEVILYRQ